MSLIRSLSPVMVPFSKRDWFSMPANSNSWLSSPSSFSCPLSLGECRVSLAAIGLTPVSLLPLFELKVGSRGRRTTGHCIPFAIFGVPRISCAAALGCFGVKDTPESLDDIGGGEEREDRLLLLRD